MIMIAQCCFERLQHNDHDALSAAEPVYGRRAVVSGDENVTNMVKKHYAPVRGYIEWFALSVRR